MWLRYLVFSGLMLGWIFISNIYGHFPADFEGERVRLNLKIVGNSYLRKSAFGNYMYWWAWGSWKNELVGFEVPILLDRPLSGSTIVLDGSLQVLESDGSSIVRRWVLRDAEIVEMRVPHIYLVLSRMRETILSVFCLALPYSESGLLAGMVLGSKEDLSVEMVDRLQRMGLIHIMVASGFNVFLVATPLYTTFKLLFSRTWAIVLAIVGIWVYVLFIGVEAPVVRAAIMACLSFIGLGFGRVRNGFWILFLTALVMIGFRPVWAFDLGWQLSMAATVGLVVVEPFLRQFAYLRWESLRLTIAAQIVVLPLLIGTFGQVSWMALFSNVLVLWLVPIISEMGMVAGILSLVDPSVGSWFVESLFPLLHIIVTIVNL